MDCENFLRIQKRLAELRNEEEAKLHALAELQKAYLAANSDLARDQVKQTVGEIRELSKAARSEIRELKQQLLLHISIEKANELYEQFLTTQH